MPPGNRGRNQGERDTMQIELTSSDEIANDNYRPVEPGRVYYAPGKLLIVDDADQAILIVIGDSGS